MLLSIGEQEADPGHTVSFFKDGKSITKGGEQDIESAWSIKTEDGVEILNVISEDNLISNEIKKLDSKTLILQDGPDQVVFSKQ